MEGGDLRMSTVDERVVRVQFDNANFQRAVQQTLTALTSLNKALQMQGATKGLDNVSTASGRTRDALGRFAGAGKDIEKVGASAQSTVSPIEKVGSAVESIGGKFKAMSVIGVTALATVTQKAVTAGVEMVKSLSLDPVLDGFHEYETNLNAIQTILANTQASGATLKDVNNTLNDLNHYSDQTVYNFSEMAKNIGTFTAAGVDLKTSAASIKGIANLAALSGSNSEQASTAMYQLSQAISSGTFSLEDWNSVVNAGMGGTVFQRALAQTAEKMGTLSDGAVKLSGKMKNVSINGESFRQSITAKPGEKSWLTSKVLTATLQQFTGDLSDAQLKAEGFSKSEIKAIQAQAKTAKEAATQVKTFSQLMDTTKEAIGSGWSQTFQLIFGDFSEAKGLFTGISNSLNTLISNSSNARNKMLADWKKFGGRDALIQGFTNAFQALGSVLKPIKDAFREIFPATTGKQLADMTKTFAAFMAKLKIGSDTADKLKRTFAGVFAVLGIGWDIIKGVGSVLAHLFGVVASGSGGFLNLTARIGDFLVNLKKSIEQGDGLKKFFQVLGTVLAVPIKLLQQAADWVGKLFDRFGSFDAGKAVKGVDDVTQSLGPFGKLMAFINDGWGKLLDGLKNLGGNVGPIIDKVATAVSTIGDKIKSMFSDMNFSDILSVFNTGLFAGLVLLIKKFVDKFKGGGGGFGDIVDSISEGFETLTNSLKAMQNLLKATTLLEIAAAVGILAVSMNILAKIDAQGLIRASTAMTVMFSQLIGSLAVFQKFVGTAGFLKLPFVMGSLILLAGAVLVLVQAVKQLSGLDWNSLSKGLTGVTVLLGGLLGVMKLMPNPTGMIAAGLGMIALATGVKILASSVQSLSGLSWADLARGLTGVGALLASLTLFTMFAKADAGGIAQGAGLILLATGIKILASAVKDMSKLSWGGIAKGLVTLAGSLAVITGALYLIPPTAPLAAAGVLGVAVSLGMIAKALQVMAKMSWGAIGKSLVVMLGALTLITAALYVIPPTAPLAALGVLGVALSLQMIAGVLQKLADFSWEEIGKSMVLLAGTLALIVGAMLLMTTALPGAAALLIVSAALMVLQPVLAAFGQMSLAEIGKSLLMLAGVFVVIGLASVVLAPVVPVIIALGVAIGILGVAMLAAGAGVFLFATGIATLAAAGTAGAAAVIGIVSGLIDQIPHLMKAIGDGVVAFAKVIATAGPAIFKAMTTVISSMISAIAKLTPQIVTTLARLLLMLLNTLASYVPQMVSAGLRLLTGILNGIANNIGKVITAATNVIVNFINGISKNLPRVIDAGVKLIISFINGVAKAINQNSAALGQAGANLASAIISGMAKGLAAGVGTIASKAKSVASSALSAAKGVLGINSPSKEFEKIGNYVNDGFKKGLDGNKSQIDSAFNSMSAQLKALSKDAKATAKERAKALSAYSLMNSKSYKAEHTQLDALATKYDQYTQKIKDAQQALVDIKKTRDDFKKSITDQYSVLPDITTDTTVSGYETDLKTQIEKTKEFANTLQRLRDLGLNDTAYKELLSKGIDALPFANNLLAGGKDAVNEINSLDSQLAAAAKALGSSASSELYDAAVHSAEGLVKGLQQQQAAIEKQMDKIADAMVKAIKKKLGIKSPARAFIPVGQYSAEGVAVGLSKMSGLVEKASADVGDKALTAMSKSVAGFSDLITSDIDIQPVITPKLDLSTVKKSSGQIGSLLAGQPVSVDAAFAKAKAISTEKASSAEVSSMAAAPVSKTVNYTQNNYSPKALSPAEIYRQTNNQLSKAKEALT